jgi:hypothetical protein
MKVRGDFHIKESRPAAADQGKTAGMNRTKGQPAAACCFSGFQRIALHSSALQRTALHSSALRGLA